MVPDVQVYTLTSLSSSALVSTGVHPPFFHWIFLANVVKPCNCHLVLYSQLLSLEILTKEVHIVNHYRTVSISIHIQFCNNIKHIIFIVPNRNLLFLYRKVVHIFQFLTFPVNGLYHVYRIYLFS